MPKVEGVLDLLVDGVFGRLQVDGALDLLDKGVPGLLVEGVLIWYTGIGRAGSC